MPIVMGAGIGYSPLLYRQREDWPAVSAWLRGDAIQPRAAAAEDAAVLDGYAARIDRGFDTVGQAIADAGLDALILLVADRGSHFDRSHVPQIHLQVGGEIWGNPAIAELGEAPRQVGFQCEAPAAEILIEELVRDGFDIAEGRDFRPVGDPERGVAPAACEAAARLAGELPLIPVSINCHVAPLMRGQRLLRFGTALARAAALSDKRLGILVSGGLSGDPRGPMSGWVDDVFDRKGVLTRIERGKPADLARIWNVPSRNLLAGTSEVRLWTVAAAALDHAGCRAAVHDYMPIHHAAAGVAFVTWRN